MTGLGATAWQPYLGALRRAWPLIMLVSVAAALIAYGVVERQGPAYTVHFSYLVALAEREESATFEFDGYYALQATDLFAATVAAWAKSPEVVVAAYDRAGIEGRSADARVLVRAVEANKRSPQLVQVAVTHRDRETAEQLARGLQEVLGEQVAIYHERGIPALHFNAVSTQSWTSVRQPATRLLVTTVFLLVLVVAINLVLLKQTFIQG